jgi:MinD-like ATPase involved in chromosome partitioning or flagellar assembly
MSVPTDTQNVDDDEASGQEIASDGPFWGQIARGRRTRSQDAADGPRGNSRHENARDGDDLAASAHREVHVRRVCREDVYERRLSLSRRVVAGVSAWLLSSDGEAKERALEAGLRNPAPNTRMNVVTVMGQRGGVGKTSIAVIVGGLIAEISRLNVVACDADLDYGPLADHVPDQNRSGKTIVDLLHDFPGEQAVALPRLRPYLSRMPSGLLVLAAPCRRQEMRELTAGDLDRVLALLGSFDLCLLDCAAGVERDLAPWATSRADRLIIVTTAEYIGADNVGQVISELPLEKAILAINKVRDTKTAGGGSAALEQRLFARLLEQRFIVRYDDELHQMLDQARLDIKRLGRAIRLEVKKLAVAITQGLR